MAFSPNGRYLAIYENDPTQRKTMFDGTVTLYEVETGRRIAEPARVQGGLRDWHLDPQSRHLALALWPGQWTTHIWKLPR